MSSTLRAQVDHVLEKFGAGVGLPECRLDAAGAARIGFDGVLVSFDLDEADGHLSMLALLGTLAEEQGGLLATMLDANLGRDGLIVARDAGTGLVMLLRRLPVDGLDVKVFDAALEVFLARAEALQARLAADPGEAPPASPAPQPELSPWSNVIRG